MDTRDSEDKLSRPMTRSTQRMSGKGEHCSSGMSIN